VGRKQFDYLVNNAGVSMHALLSSPAPDAVSAEPSFLLSTGDASFFRPGLSV
jgi:hypothetical protein